MLKSSCSIILICLTLAACERSNLPNSAQPQKITIAYTNQPQSTLIHVGLVKGYFLEEGLEVESLMHTYGKMALQAVVEKKADFATVAETPVMFAVLKGEPIQVIANIESSSLNNGIVSRKNTGIAVPKDLKGKQIGFTPGTTSDFFLDSFLTANGLTRGDIHPTPLKPEAMLDALMEKQVDAVSTWNYPLTQMKHRLASNGTIFYDREIYTETFNIASRSEFIQKDPETVKHLLRALIKAEVFVHKYPEEAQTILSARIKVDRSLIQEVWSDFHYHVGLDQTLLITLEDETRWAIKNKLTDRTAMPDFLKSIYFDGLLAVKPEAVKMNR